MPLFIDRLPLHAWTDSTRSPPFTRWSVPLPVVLSDPAASAPPPDVVPQRWAFDTAFTGDAFAWRYHLEAVGLDPDQDQVGTVRAVSSLGDSTVLPVRYAALWLVSNLPALRAHPFRLALEPGIAFRNILERPDPEFHRPLVGLRALRRAGVRVLIDFARATVSVWTPGPWHQGLAVFLRRAVSGFATQPMTWSNP